MLLASDSHALISPGIDKLINLLIFVGLLVFLLRKPMAQFFASRAQEIEAQIKRAEREKQEALAQLKSVEERLNRLDAEIAEMKAQTSREAEAEYQRIITTAHEEAAKLKDFAAREIQRMTKAAKVELKDFAAEQSVGLAEAQLRREIKEEDAHRMVADYINELEATRR